MKTITRIFLSVSIMAGLGWPIFEPRAVGADATTELATFSVFNNLDLPQLAKVDVKTARGAPMTSPQLLSVQSCYLAMHAPAQEIAALRQWSPDQHRELKIFLHTDLPASPGPDNFSRLRSAPDNAAVRSLVTNTQNLSTELQISQGEAKKFTPGGAAGTGTMPDNVATFWMNLLNGRARDFISGGTAQQPPYDHGGASVKPNDEINALLRQQGRIRQQFASFLSTTGIGRGAGTKPELYWELLEVDGDGVLTLGASYNRSGPGGTYQAADVLYYASGGYYVNLTLYQMWPITFDGHPATLVWRADMTSSATLASLHGIERLASESAMMKQIGKAITLYRRGSR